MMDPKEPESALAGLNLKEVKKENIPSRPEQATKTQLQTEVKDASMNSVLADLKPKQANKEEAALKPQESTNVEVTDQFKDASLNHVLEDHRSEQVKEKAFLISQQDTKAKLTDETKDAAIDSGNTIHKSKDSKENKSFLHPYKDIPTRIKNGISLTVKESKVCSQPGIDRGIFTLKAFKAGDLVFSIPNPLLILGEIVKVENMNFNCDNCMLCTQQVHNGHASNAFQTKVLQDGRLTKCACKTLWYCSPECAASAWDSHHQWECNELYDHTQKCISSGKLPDRLHDTCFRATLRLCLMWDKSGSFGRQEKDEILALRGIQIPKLETDEWKKVADANCKKIYKIVKPEELSFEDIVKFYSLVASASFPIKVPIIKVDTGSLDVLAPVFLEKVTCIDPFASLINHSCDPNVKWHSEGREIYVRAIKAIPIDTELTASYVSGCLDRKHIQEQLSTVWGFKCKCGAGTCKEGNDFPTGTSRRRALDMFQRTPNDWSGVPEIEEFLKSIKDTKWGKNGPLITKLYYAAYQKYIEKEKLTEAIKMLIRTLSMLHKGHAKNSTFLSSEESLNVFAVLLQILRNDMFSNKNPIPSIKFNRARTDINLLLTGDYFELKELYVIESRRVFGPNTEISMYAQRQLDWEAAGKYQQMRRDHELIPAFVKDFNECLVWAEVPKVTQKELMGNVI